MIHTTRTKTALGALMTAALLALTACGGDGSDDASGEVTSQEQSAEGGGEAPDLEGVPDVVAEVNGEEVTKDEFAGAYQARLQQAAMQAQLSGEEPDEQEIREQTAENLVDIELLKQEAAARGIEASDEDVDDALDRLAEQNQLTSPDELLAKLEEQGTSEDQARAELGTQVVVERLIEDEAGDLEPTEKELRTLYRQAKQQQKQAGGSGGEGGAQAVPPFAEVRDQLEQQARSQEQGRVVQALVEDLREDADITINL